MCIEFMELDKNQIKEKLKHIAFIMDGNGRWATRRGKPREYGHKFGVETFKRVVEYCRDIGISAVTVFVFSTENWNRPKHEVDTIMALFAGELEDALQKIIEYDTRIVFIGDRSVFKGKILNLMNKIERDSENNTMILNVAINYGGREEIVNAVNTLISEGATNVTAADIASKMYTSHCPDPDLIVRTGADTTVMRTSNFLTWQSIYSELYFTDILWPDFSNDDVDEAIMDFLNRKRRFGGI